MQDVIILGDSYSMSLGLIRALGEKGYSIKLLKKTNSINESITPEEVSKYVVQTIRVSKQKESILNGLSQFANKKEKVLIIPGDDASALFLDENASVLSDRFFLPTMKKLPGKISGFMDKIEQKRVAKQCGLPVAEGEYYATDASGRKEAVENVSYPCFVKPLISAGISKKIIGSCNSLEELSLKMKQAEEEGCLKVLIEKQLDVVQEYVCNGVALDNKVYLPSCIVVARRGVGRRKGVTAEGTVYDSKILGDFKNRLEEYVATLGFVGLFDIELMVCKDGIYFCEMNLRNGATGYAVTLAGANLPGILADFIYKGTLPYAVNIKKQITFVSEKVEMDCFLDGNISLRQLRKDLSPEKSRFIKDAKDTKPNKVLRKMFIIYCLIKIRGSIRKIITTLTDRGKK